MGHDMICCDSKQSCVFYPDGCLSCSSCKEGDETKAEEIQNVSELMPSHFTIRTSDRRTFRRCRRKWEFMSSLKGNNQRKGTEQNTNFWFGSAIHFAMEDFHGWNRFKDPRRAFHAYYEAFPADEIPAGADAHYELGMAMLSYYLTWYDRHNISTGFETAWLDKEGNFVPPKTEGAEPAVEVSFSINLSVWGAVSLKTQKIIASYWVLCDLPAAEGDIAIVNGESCLIVPIKYHGTMDRIVVDKYGRYWILDYKTAKSADTNKLDTDDQISAYLWAATKIFKVPFYGFIYLQLTKEAVQEPRRLKNGTLSVDKKQKTTYSLLKQEILKDYGKVSEAPNALIQFLNVLAASETPEGDRFIRWDFIKRDEEQLQSTEKYIYYELRSMLDLAQYAYPSPTRDCIWDCPLRDICISMDRNDKATIEELMLNWEQRPRNEDGNLDPWRENIKWPKGNEDLIPIEEILSFDQCLKIEMGSQADQEETLGFQFYYED